MLQSCKKGREKEGKGEKFASIWERLSDFATSTLLNFAAGAAEVDSPRCARILAVTFVTMAGSLYLKSLALADAGRAALLTACL